MRATLLLGMTASALVSGCGVEEDACPRQQVGGTVKWNGEPLKQGRIQFQPAGPAAPAGGAAIVDGSYAISRSGTGEISGANLRRGRRGPVVRGPDWAAGQYTSPKKAVKDPIPDKYNAKSQLTREVTKDGPNQFDFELPDK